MHILRRLGSLLSLLLLLLSALPAHAVLSQPTDNNLHIDRGVSYTNTVFLSATGGTAPYTFTFPGSLPSGVTVSSDGLLTGVTCGANGTYPLGTVTVTDALGATASKNGLTLIVNAAPAGGCSLTVTATLSAGTTGSAYSGSITASGGSSPYTFSLASGSLPPGVTLSSTGTLSGTPTAAGTYSFSVLVTDAGGATGSQTFSLTINAGGVTITVAPASLTAGVAGVAGVAYSQAITASGGMAPYGYAVTSGSLPAGLSLAGSGTLSGTPSAAGSSSFTVTATDANGATGTRSYTLSIGAALSTTQAVASSSLTAGVAATAFTPVTAAGGTAPYSYAVSPALPAGLSFNAGTGQVSGTPGAASASATYTVTVTDANGTTSSKTFTLSIGAALSTTQAVASSSLTAGVAATAFTPVTATGGTAPYSYAVSPALPAGLSFNAGTGQVSGTPGAASASATYTVTVTDANGTTSSKTFTLIVNAAASVAITPSGLTAGVVGVAYSQAITASGGTAPYGYAVTSGSLPAGLSLAGSGTLSGTPSAAGSSSFTVTATDANGATGTRSYTLSIGAALSTTQAVASSSLTAGVAATAFTPVTASGGTAPHGFAVSPALPAGLSFNAGTGQVSGTPGAASASATYTVTVTDANGTTSSKTFTLIVNAAASVAITPSGLTAGVAGVAYSQAITASGGTAPYGYAVTSGSLPAGLSLAGSGTLSGTPSTAGSSSFTVTATDANGATGTRSYTLSIGAALSTTQAVASSSLTAGVAATAFTPVTAAGGTAPYSYAVSPALPAGLSFNAGTGQVSGTPSAASASATYTVTVTDANGTTSSKTFTLGIGAMLSTTQAVASSSLTAGVTATAFTPVTASGGTAPYGFAVSPALPAGLSFNAGTGQVSGTPGAASASATYTVTVTDANGTTSSKSFTLGVGAGLVTTQASASTTLTSGTAATAFTPVTASGGTAPYVFAITPALPAGLNFDTATGEVSGTPSAASASATYTVTVTDANGRTSSKTFTLEVRAALAAATQVDNTVAQIDSPVGPFTPVVVTGGLEPYSFSVGPSLPNGLMMNPATGEVTGTPTASTPMTDYTVTVADASGARALRVFRLATTAPVGLDVQPRQIDLGAAGTPVSAALVASGGTAPYRFELVSGTWPAGLSMDSTGRISGRARGAAAATLTVRVTDADGSTLEVQISLQVGSRPDPTADAGVVGLQVAQAEALKRFGSAQLRNMLDRLDDDRECLPELDARARLAADWRQASTVSDAKDDAALPAAKREKKCATGLAGWMAGTVQRGRIDGAAGSGATRFSSPGLTLGWDAALMPGVRAGFAFGHGSDRSELAAAAGQLDARSDSISAYATWRTPLGLRLSAAVGQASAKLATQRTITGDTLVVEGDRRARHTFAALAGSARLDFGRWHLGPQVVVERQRARLAAYTESGASPLALAYDDATLVSNEVRGGLKLSLDWPLGVWTLEPNLMVEWRRRSAGELSQGLRYADDPAGASYTLVTRDPAQEQGQLGVGLRARALGGWSASVELRSTLGGSARTGSLAASLQRNF